MIYIAFLILTLAILLFAFYQWQYFMVFSPTHYRDEKFPEAAELVTIVSDDGKELEGVVHSPKGFTNTLLFFAGRSHDSVGLIVKLAQTYPHSQIITFNYRSYGKSEGRASEKALLNDALKIAQVVEKNYGAFYLLGFSLGSSISAYIASRMQVKALFLVGAFDSIASLAHTKYKIARFLRYKFVTEHYVKSVDAPTYLFASVDDEITYIKNARELKRSVKNLSFYLELDALTHKEILWDSAVTLKIREVIE